MDQMMYQSPSIRRRLLCMQERRQRRQVCSFLPTIALGCTLKSLWHGSCSRSVGRRAFNWGPSGSSASASRSSAPLYRTFRRRYSVGRILRRSPRVHSLLRSAADQTHVLRFGRWICRRCALRMANAPSARGRSSGPSPGSPTACRHGPPSFGPPASGRVRARQGSRFLPLRLPAERVVLMP